MTGTKARIPALAFAALMASCGGGSSAPANACTDPAAPRATVTSGPFPALLLPGVPAADLGTPALTVSSFQLQLVEPVRFATGGFASAGLGSSAAIGAGGDWSTTGVNPACVGVGILSATVEAGRTDFVVLTGVLQTVPAGSTSVPVTSPSYAVPRAFLERIAGLVGISALAEGFVVVYVPPAVNGAGGVTVTATPVTAPPAGGLHTVHNPDAAFAAAPASGGTAGHGIAVVRRTGPAGFPLQLDIAVAAGAALPACSASVTTGCWVPAQGSAIPRAAFVAPITSR